MTPEDKLELKKFFRALDDRPLEPKDPVYVPIHKRFDDDPIQRLVANISMQASASVDLLFGQRGSGKSTELRRLKGLLEEQGCEVFLCDLEDYLNTTQPVEEGDFMITLMGAFNDEVNKRFKVDETETSYWERTTQFLSQEIKLDHASLKVGGDNLRLALKENHDFKDKLREKLGPYSELVKNQAWAFAAKMVDRVRFERNDPDKKVVVLVDSLEKMGSGSRENALKIYHSVADLFSGHSKSLMIPKLSILYTIPPYLPSLVPNLAGLLAGATLNRLPSVHVSLRNGGVDEGGVEIMRKIVDKRLSGWQKIFTPEGLGRLAVSSGGDLRDFFRLIQHVLITVASRKKVELPVGDSIIKSAEVDLKAGMLPIAKQDAWWLWGIIETKKAELNELESLFDLARFFDTKLVLNYRNGDSWYDVHPLLKNEILEMIEIEQERERKKAAEGEGGG
ncbi:MAG: hypothetical protein HQL52_09265 [Magnetococcales bacterium]|nr:hypothetical protein [Magnetococcales bacterium]